MASDDPPTKECLHKTKFIQFLGRTTHIVLQNENGPCPLLPICNVLLLKNNLNMTADYSEVSQEKLLSLVAERLIDANSNFEDKDPNYVKNQQQNISDALEFLPHLTTGIDVNLKFTGIRDFEFTPECAIFDLLDIPLYHGWIMDPQDLETANAIWSKSYNRIMSELVSLETRAVGENDKCDFVDLSAATTAALGIPSPSLSRGISFDESPRCVAEDGNDMKKGNLEENKALLKALKLTEDRSSSTTDDSATPIAKEHILNDCHNGVETLPISPLHSVDPAMLATSDADQTGSEPHASAPLTPTDCQNQTSIATSSDPVSSSLTNDERHGCHIHEAECSNDVELCHVLIDWRTLLLIMRLKNESGSGSTCEKTGAHDNTAILHQEDTKTFTDPQSGPNNIVTDHLLVPDSSSDSPANSTSISNISAGALVCNEMDAEDPILVIANKESENSQIVDEVKEPIDEGEQ